MVKVDKKLVFLVVIVGVLLLSMTFASAFNLGDWLRGLFGANKITGYDILEGRLTSYSFDSAIGTNVVIATEGVGGKSGNFSGNGYVSMPLSEFPAYPSSGSTTNYNISFSVWFKTSGKGAILGQNNGGINPEGAPGGRVPALYIGNDGKLYASLFWHGYGGTTGYNQLVSSSVVNDNSWHHAVVTYSAGTEALYLDGNTLVSWQPVSQVAYGANKYTLGTAYAPSWPQTNNWWFYFNGLIDEAAVYNRPLTASEVSTIYTEQKSKISSSGGGGGGDGSTLLCLDSDGKGYYNSGNVILSWSNGIYINTYYDQCINDRNLTEYYCENAQLKNETYNCPYGCSNGACSQPTAAACTDSDGGVNYYVKGNATYHGSNYTDYCSDSTTLLEYSCDVDGKYTYQSYRCQDGCDNAVCNRQIQPPISEVVNLASTARRLYIYDSINSAKTALSSSDLPNLLKDGKFVDLTGKEYPYAQTINPGSSKIMFGNSAGDLADPAVIIDAGTDPANPIFNYTLSLARNLNVTDSTNVQGKSIKVLGVDYLIGAGSTNTTLYLYGAGNSLKLQNGASVKRGANEDSVKGTTATVTAAGDGLISRFTISFAANSTRNDHIKIGEVYKEGVFGTLSVHFAAVTPALDSSSRKKIIVGTDNIQFAYVIFTPAQTGKEGITDYAYDNDTSSIYTKPILAGSAGSNGKGVIHVLEGENAREGDYFVINQGDSGAIVRVDNIRIDSATEASVELLNIMDPDAEFISVFLTKSAGRPYQRTGVNMFGGIYTVMVNPEGTLVNITWNGDNAKTLFPRIKLKDGGGIAFLTEKKVRAGGEYIILPWSDKLYSSGVPYRDGFVFSNISFDSPEAVCNFNLTIGPAILFIEPNMWFSSATSRGNITNFICIPLRGAYRYPAEITIGDPIFNGTTPAAGTSFITWNSDSYKKQAVDKYGTLVTKEDRPNENGVVTLAYPSAQMYADIFIGSAQGSPQPLPPPPEEPPLPPLSEEICNGCILENKCVPIGYRQESKYCSIKSEFVSQLGVDGSCYNNFECSANLCIDNKCVSSGLWQKFLRFLKGLF